MSHLAIIFGGPSAEHDVSLVSAKNIYEVLSGTQLKTSLLGVTKNKIWKLIKPTDLLKTDFIKPLNLDEVGLEINLTQEKDGVFIVSQGNQEERMGPIDVAFPIVHGPYGEDGQLQTELNQLGLEFIGSDFLSCENCFDKAKTKDILAEKNIPQVPHLVFSDENPNFNDLESRLGTPFFVKPASMGSSIGIAKVSEESQLMTALADARIHDKKIVIEKGVEAREIECAILENGEVVISGLGEIKSNHDFYSYEAKYLDPNGADLIIPAEVPEETKIKIQEMASQCFKILGCRDYARADFFLTQDQSIFFNEINTHPGFTNISQFPMLWKQEGVSYKDLILKLVNQATKRQTGK